MDREMIKQEKKTAFYPSAKLLRTLSLVVVITFLNQQQSIAQSPSDYHPGEAIKFHDMSSGSSSNSSSSTNPSNSSTSSIAGSSANFLNGNNIPSSGTTLSVSTSAAPKAAQPTGDSSEKGLGSFLKNVVRQELRTGNIHQGYYNNAPAGNNYGGGYGGSSHAYINPLMQQGQQSQSSLLQNQQRPGSHMNFSRPDAVQENNNSYAQINSNSNHGGGQQSGPRISSNIMEFVTSNPPVPMSGDIENFIPSELHAKAYGKELGRNGPMNGAEDNDHLF